MRAKSVMELVMNYLDNETSPQPGVKEIIKQVKEQVTLDSKWDIVFGIPSTKKDGQIDRQLNQPLFIDDVIFNTSGAVYKTFFDADDKLTKDDFEYEFINLTDLDDKSVFPNPDAYMFSVGDFKNYNNDSKFKTIEETKQILKANCPNYKLAERPKLSENLKYHNRPFRIIDKDGLEPVAGLYLKIFKKADEPDYHDVYINLFTNQVENDSKIGPIFYLSPILSYSSVKYNVPNINKPIAYQYSYAKNNSIATFVDPSYKTQLNNFGLSNSIELKTELSKDAKAWTIIDMDEAKYVVRDLLGMKIKGEKPPKPVPPPVPEPGDQINTQPGQPQNNVDNKGGTGDRTTQETVFPDSKNVLTTSAWGTNCVFISPAQFNVLRSELFSPSVLSTKRLNPDDILAVNLWPFNIAKVETTGNIVTNKKTNIGERTFDWGVLKALYKGAQGQEVITDYVLDITPDFNHRIDIVKDYTLKPYFGGFLDYEPFSSAQIYLPYVGFANVSCQDLQNEKISIWLLFDPLTGSAEYHLKSSTQAHYIWKTTLTEQMPLNLSDKTNLLNNILFQNLGNSQAGTIVSGVTQGVQSLFNNQQHRIGNSGDMLSRFNTQDVYLFITRKETVVPDDFNSRFGRPSEISVSLDKLKGFTQIDTPHITTTATEPEKQQLIQLLKEGVILK